MRKKNQYHTLIMTQWETLFKEFPKVKFIKVNPDIIRNTAISSNVEEWNTYTKKNLSYMTFNQLNETFQHI